MTPNEIKDRAWEAAHNPDGKYDTVQAVEGMELYEMGYFLAMAYLYKCYSIGAIFENQKKGIEEKLSNQFSRLAHGLYFAEEHKKTAIRQIRETNLTRVQLAKQLRDGDPASIDTLFQLLDAYTCEYVYLKLSKNTKFTEEAIQAAMEKAQKLFGKKESTHESANRRSRIKTVGEQYKAVCQPQ